MKNTVISIQHISVYGMHLMFFMSMHIIFLDLTQTCPYSTSLLFIVIGLTLREDAGPTENHPSKLS